MEVYVLVARRWRAQHTGKTMTRLLTKMVENANVIFSKKSDNEEDNYPHSLVSLDWKHGRKNGKEKEIDAPKFDAAIDREAKVAQYAPFAFGIKFAFEEVKMANGKTIKYVEGDCNEETGWKYVTTALHYAGRAFTDDKMHSASVLKDKLYISSRWDDGYAVSVIDLKQDLPDGVDPVPQEIARGNSDEFYFERSLPILWWNTKKTLVREGQVKLTLPESEKRNIVSYGIYSEHLLVNMEAARGEEASSALAVYHRKSGAQVLFSPLNERNHLYFLTLKPSLETLICRNGFDLTFWLISGKNSSAPATLPREKISPSAEKESVSDVCLREGALVNCYSVWL